MRQPFDNPFREDTHTSMMRVCVFICVVIAGFIGLMAPLIVMYALATGAGLLMIAGILAGLAGVITALLVPAFGGKAIQSYSENKEAPDASTAIGNPMQPV
jgi:hypothetical protein